ncbi:purine phosphorylase [Nocardioides sp. NPDC057772]|uniref:5'-methylthioadenosine/S-adenosylhomocysteine nucleosidase family protein n=1 Tax=Nocardioides sp. NPDC057772 TaxID=3346245 RepID=UPI0036722743
MTEPRVAVVLTALDIEYKAVRDHLTDLESELLESGTRYEIGTVRGTSCRVVIGVTEAGNSSAAVLAERAIQRYAPVALLFSGVAGAMKDSINLGDVVVGSKIYAYQSAAGEDDGLKARPQVWPLNHAVSETARFVASNESWAKRLLAGGDVPRVTRAPIAAGDVVQKSRISREAAWIRQHYNDTAAIEMEGAGVAEAGRLNSVPVGVVRGISDRADGGKTVANDEHWQPRAAAHAAAFAVELAVQMLETGPVAAKSTSRIDDGTDSAAQNGPAGNGNGAMVFNFSSGTVGVQANTVNGGTLNVTGSSVSGSTQDISALVAELRMLLQVHHAAGRFDTDTMEDALDELDIAEKLANDPDLAKRHKAARALQKVGGVMSDVTDIAAKAAAAASHVQGML